MESKYIERFIDNLDQETREKTKTAYAGDLKMFYKYLQECFPEVATEKELISNVNNDVIEDYKRFMTKVYAKSSINRKLGVLALYFEYICVNKSYLEILTHNPMAGIKKMKRVVVKKKDSLSVEEIKQLIEACYIKEADERSFDFISKRNAFIIGLVATTGLRISEALTMTFDQLRINYEYTMIQFDSGIIKNHIEKIVPMTETVQKLYDEYMIERAKLKKNSSNTIIISANGGNIKSNGMNKQIEKILRKAGIEKEITNHSFRKSFRTITLALGFNEELIRLTAGWATDSVSRAYIDGNTTGMDLAKIKMCSFL